MRGLRHGEEVLSVATGSEPLTEMPTPPPIVDAVDHRDIRLGEAVDAPDERVFVAEEVRGAAGAPRIAAPRVVDRAHIAAGAEGAVAGAAHHHGLDRRVRLPVAQCRVDAAVMPSVSALSAFGRLSVTIARPPFRLEQDLVAYRLISCRAGGGR